MNGELERITFKTSIILALVACGSTGMEGDPPCWDHDDDGYPAAACGGTDCDDSRPDVHPRADEVCLDGIDQDCDGIIDGPTVVFERGDLMYEPDACSERGDVSLKWTGSEYGIAWSFDSRLCEPADRFYGTYFTRLSADGRIMMERAMLDFAPRDDWEEMGQVALVWTGSMFGLSWISTSLALDYVFPSLHFRKLSADGSPLSEPLRLREYPDEPTNPLPAWTGSKFGLIWSQGGYHPDALVLTSIQPEPIEAEEDVIIAECSGYDYVSDPDAIWTGSQFGIVWITLSEVDDTRTLHFVRTDEAGTELSHGEWPCETGNARIVFTGSEYGVTWEKSGLLHVLRFDVDGDPVDAEQVISVDLLTHTEHLFWTAYGYFAVGHDSNASPCFVQIDVTGSEKLLESSLEDFRVPCMSSDHAWTGSEFGLAWTHPVDPMLPMQPNTITFMRIGFCD